MNTYFNEKSTQMTTKQRKGIHSTASTIRENHKDI